MNTALSTFQGIVPRYSRHTLSSQQATIAHNCKLRNGRIEAWRELCDYSELKGRSFYSYGIHLFTWNDAVSAATLTPDWRCLYTTGRNGNGLETLYYDCEGNPSYTLAGVPAPTQPPVAAGTETCGRDSDGRSYVYTYVNEHGEESAPSPASNVIIVSDGASVSVTGIAYPPEGYGIIAANIYRAASAAREANAKVQNPVSDFFYVGAVMFPSTSFADSKKLLDLQWACDTSKNREPPAGLRNVCSIEGTVRLAGTTTNQVHLSEFYQPYNWPARYDLTLDYGIVHMGCLDQKLYVTTDSIPYVIDVSSCEDMKAFPVMDVQQILPDISCGYSSSAIVTPFGYVYSSMVGAILINPKAQWTVLTAQWLSRDDWQQIRPDTARFAYWEGYLFIITDMASFILDMHGDPFGDMRGTELTTIDDKPLDMRVTNTGLLLMLFPDGIKAWDAGDTYRPYHWVSRDLTGGQDTGPGRQPDATPPEGFTWSPASAKIRTRETEFTLYNSRGERVYTRLVTNDKPFRLPRVGRQMFWRAEFKGTEPVEFFDMGTSNFTVNAGV